ncbi:hypothetical protein [Gibbsiella quercinecans]|uniref:hypothetical protein n=1 Tax=Gibbsiella quercinecans TaxID=929813 RepID=UPI00242C54ED|nr:hypothetical protein [Gibbsiella quercinecans]
MPAVRGLLNCVGSKTAPCETLKIRVREQLDEIDRRIETLYESRALLNQLLTL